MTNNLFNEILLLKRYKLFNYNYFIIFNPSFNNYLRKMYLLYKKDLRCDFLSLPIALKVDLETIENKEINYSKRYIVEDIRFVKRISQLSNIFLKCPPKYNGKIPYLKWKTKLMLDNRKKFEKYNKLFEQLSNCMFKRCVELLIPVSTLDKIILSLKIENFLHLHILLCLVAAFFRYILHHKNNKFYKVQETCSFLQSAKPQKVKYRRFSV